MRPFLLSAFLVVVFCVKEARAFVATHLSPAVTTAVGASSWLAAPTSLVLWAVNDEDKGKGATIEAILSSIQEDKETNSPAEKLLEKARLLREEIKASENTRRSSPTSTSQATKLFTTSRKITSPWSLVETDTNNGDEEGDETTTSQRTAYRFYIDIGREQGTWMEPRWGASGQRIEFTLDVRFSTTVASKDIAADMVQDNRGGLSTPVYELDTAPFARLRGGFDRMKCDAGAYRIDTSNRGQKTLRLFIRNEGKTSGDVSVPTDSHLYIALPVLADSSLSRKEGIVSVRQYGWHTGWYRAESRIVGVVKAVPLAVARAKDGF